MKTIQQITSLRILSVLTVIISSFMMHGCAHYQPRGDAGAICPDGNPPFTFVVIGDTRPGMPAYPDDPGTPSIDYLEQIHWINRLNPDFTIVVGDLIRGYNSKHPGLLEQQWDGFDETVSLYKTPLYMVVGNHDVWDDYSDKIYQQRYGPQYFSFDHKKCHFIVLSADIPYKLNKIDQTQIKWLKEDLISSKDALHKFVFLHKPIWLPDYIGNTVWLSTIHELFKKHNVDAVFAGHEHHYEPFLIDNIPYFITGGGGAEIGGR
ncbi:metallophosphoesterase, partial [PVC group bacterium]|nr:metallophosphoesterase [PVC group bacterium]